MILTPLRRKVLRDLWRLRAQALAIALVLAAGVATLVLGTGAHDALERTRALYYDAHRFADVFADATRAPRALLDEIAGIDGVLAAEGRITRIALTDMPGMSEPGSVALVSLPEGAGGLNRLHLRLGRLPDPQAAGEAVVSEAFARAHRLTPGTRISILMNGRLRAVEVVGVGLSPEFVYALGPGEMMPDPRRFGVVWMPRPALEAAYDLRGAMSNVVLRLAPGADPEAVRLRLDALLAPYGGAGAVLRRDQLSHAFLEAELSQLRAMVRVLPPIFLAVAAMLVNMTLQRLVALEREQIGLLKAIGYSARAVALHYVEFVGAIALAGIAIGLAAGSWLGAGMAQLYARFFAFPFLVFSRDPGVYALAAAVSGAAAVGGALLAVRAVLRLSPAVAMAPPAPALYRERFGALMRRLAPRRTTLMALRHLGHRPMRSATSITGLAMAVAVLVASQWSFGSIDHMVDATFHRAERHDAMIALAEPRPARALNALVAMPGVLAAEPFRSVPARISRGHRDKRVAIMGRPVTPKLSRVLDPDLRPMPMPEAGLLLSEALAEAIGARRGDMVTVELLAGRRQVVQLPVSGISLGYVGLGAAMEIGALNRLMGEGAVISGATLQIDPAHRADFHAAAKRAPQTAFVSLTDASLARFQDTLAENIRIMVTVYTTLAAIIAVGVVYNFARISLSEQGRELASLRVLGFTQAEVSRLLWAELAVVVLAAQPLGWAVGYAIAWAMTQAFSSDLYRVPLVVGREVHAMASLAVIVAAAASGALMAGRIRNLDLIAVLKTRE